MNPLTAVSFLFCGISILLLRQKRPSNKKQLIGKILAGLVLLIGLLRFVSLAMGLDTGIDTILFNTKLTEDPKVIFSNRMALNTAFTFVITGIGLLLMNVETSNKRMPAHFLSVFIFFVAIISILGYLYNIKLFYGSFLHIPVPVHTAIGFLFISLAILFAQPAKGITKEMTSRFSGSFIARFLIPVSITVPVLLGLLYLQGVWHRNFSMELGTGFLALSVMLIFIALTWFIVVILNKRDLQKADADLALWKLNETLEQKILERTETINRSEKQYKYLFKNNPMPMWVIDLRSFKFLDVNEMALFQYGYSRQEFLSMTALDIRPDSDKEIFKKADHSFNSSANNYRRGIWNHTKKDGSNIKVEVIGHEVMYEGVKARLILSNDVTEQKKAEEKLIASESRFRALIENNYDIISLMDADFKFIYRSPSSSRITGWTDDELRGMDGTSNIHPDDKAHAKAVIVDLAKNKGKAVNTAFRTRHKNGHYLWVEGTISNQLHKDHVNAFVFNFRDITARVEAEERLAAKEMHFRSLIENSAEGISLMDEFSNNIYRSPAAEKIIGKMPTGGDTKKLTHPDDLEMLKNIHLEVLKSPGVPIDFQARFLHAEGHYIWLEGKFTNLLNVKDVNAIVTNYRDITDRKNAEAAIVRAEANYREIFDKASDGIYVHNIPTGTIIDSNERAAEITGYSKEEILSISSRKCVTRSTEHNIIPTAVHLQKAAAGEPQLFEWLSRKKDGSFTWLEVNLKKATIAGEERILSFFREINDRKKAQEQFEKLNEELEQKVILRTQQLKRTNEELEAFSYSVSHDLRAPLRAIIGFSTILQEDYITNLDDEAKRITNVIISNTKRMGQLIDDLLTFSRMGRQHILSTDVNNNELVSEIIGEMDKKEHKHKKINWTLHQLPSVNADMNIMRQVWVNLISNAVKYSEKVAEPKIEIGAAEGNNEVTFYVKDNGVGFNEKYKDKLFKVFQRLHTTDEFEGTGIGLAIVEKIISRHGGKVWAHAEVDKGACFYFSLPITVDSEQLI